MRRDIIIIGIIFFFIGLGLNFFANNVLIEYITDKFIVDIVGTIGLFYFIFSIPAIVISIFLKEKVKQF